MIVECPRCGHQKEWGKGFGATWMCRHQGCTRSLTRRHILESRDK